MESQPMKEVHIPYCTYIDDALKIMYKYKEDTGKDCYINFNGMTANSNDTIDEAYIKIFGKSKEELNKRT